MSKYNLYNLTRAQDPAKGRAVDRGWFKRKWLARSVLRSYHGEPVRERQWQKMFSKRLRSVVPMDPAYMAQNDGSIESSGRGSGHKRFDPTQGKTDVVSRTPYMLQTFAPLERRLDVAIHRSLFASSARQARQFVLHGAVTVNGKLVSLIMHH
jgi:ribosomal protein S4